MNIYKCVCFMCIHTSILKVALARDKSDSRQTQGDNTVRVLGQYFTFMISKWLQLLQI